MTYYDKKSVFVIRRTNLVTTRKSSFIAYDTSSQEAGDACYFVMFDTLSTPKYEHFWDQRPACNGKDYKTLASARKAFRAKAIKHALAHPEKYRVEVVEVVSGATRLRGIPLFAEPTGYRVIDEKVVWPEKPVLDQLADV